MGDGDDAAGLDRDPGGRGGVLHERGGAGERLVPRWCGDQSTSAGQADDVHGL
ncbi:MAG: hypothetical protein MZV63_56450 [Marinilabiliales bacterium]|nr:hypothetical protein [Marinilabiliales bacterium]